MSIVAGTMLLAIIMVFARHPRPFGVTAVRVYSGSAGFVLEIVLLFAFQSFYGASYGWLSLLFAAFMVGISLGAIVAGRMDLSTIETPALMLLQVGLAVLATALAPLLQILGGFDHHAVLLAIPLLNLGVGALVGAQYPVSVAA